MISDELRHKISLKVREALSNPSVRDKMKERWKQRRLNPVSAETRQKMSISRKGKVFSEEHKNNLSKSLNGKNTGKSRPCSEKTKKFLSLNRKGKKRLDITGDKHPKWKGGTARTRERHRAYRQKRRAIGKLSIDQWLAIKEKYSFACPACSRQEPEIKLTIDHIIPVSKGGTNELTNIQPLCLSCNCRKQAKIIKYTHSENSHAN